MKTPLALMIFGGVVCVFLLALIMSRTSDIGVVSVALSIAMAMLWFYLSALLTRSDKHIGTIVLAKPKARIGEAISVTILGVIFLLLTGILVLLFDSYNNQISEFISLGELTVHTSRASAALQLTFGGMLAISFWLPNIVLSSYLIGRRAVTLDFWNCLSAVVLGLLLFIAANFVAELMSGDVSADRVLNSIFTGSEAGVPRLAAELWFIRLSALALGIVFLLVVTVGVWCAARVGHRHSYS